MMFSGAGPSKVVPNGCRLQNRVRDPAPSAAVAVGDENHLMHRTELLGVFMSLVFPSSSIALQRSRIQVWLYEQVNMRIEGCIIVSIVMSSWACGDWGVISLFSHS